MTYEQALKVAEKDYKIGISWSVEELTKMGFDCSTFWEDVKDVGEDYDAYIEARDKLYKLLGIEELMERAWEEVQERGIKQ